jgi:hypothetical protein
LWVHPGPVCNKKATVEYNRYQKLKNLIMELTTTLMEKFEARLVEIGGTRVATTYEEDLDKLMARGVSLPGDNARVIKTFLGARMFASRAHSNVATYWKIYKEHYGLEKAKKNIQIMTGWGLSKDGIWRQHSWVYLKNTKRIIDTTVSRVIYHGFAMTPEEADIFEELNNYHY